MKTTQYGTKKNQIKKKRIDFALSISIILILLMPGYSWLLVSLYQTYIQTPQEWKQFRRQEQQILQALQEYRNQNHIYPNTLSILEQEFPNIATTYLEKQSFHYNLNENSEFSLSTTIPKTWFGWVATRVCQSQQNAPPQCNFHYICSYKHGIQRLTDPIDQEQPSRPIFGSKNNPCI